MEKRLVKSTLGGGGRKLCTFSNTHKKCHINFEYTNFIMMLI